MKTYFVSPYSIPGQIRFILFILFFSTVLFSCYKQERRIGSKQLLPEKRVKGSLIIELDENQVEKEELQLVTKRIASRSGCELGELVKVNWTDGSHQVISEEAYGIYHLQYSNCDFTVEDTLEAMSELVEIGGVINAEAEAVVQADPVSFDPLESKQDYFSKIRRNEACEIIGHSERQIVVAVVDSGVQRNHPDLESSFYRDSAGHLVGANFVGKGPSSPPDPYFDDKSGHGTHVAGIIAAESGNQVGISGVAGCANVKIMPVRVLNSEGEGSSLEIERGIKWAADNGADIINLSLGYNSKVSSRENHNFDKWIYRYLAEQNIIVIAAAGNDGFFNGKSTEGGFLYSFPASYNNVISVAATGMNGQITNFSVRGNRVDIAAPGARIFSTYMGSGYSYLSGTSMAAPIASAVLSLGLSSYYQEIENLRPLNLGDVEKLLKESTVDRHYLETSNVDSGGVLDAFKVIKNIQGLLPIAPVVGEDIEVDAPILEIPDEEFTEELPVTPEVPVEVIEPTDEELVSKMSFLKLTEGVQPEFFQQLELSDLPEGTTWLALFWNDEVNPFTYIVVDLNTKAAISSQKWHFLGFGELSAIALNPSGKILASTKVQLAGF